MIRNFARALLVFRVLRRIDSDVVLSLFLETRDGIEITAPVKFTLSLSASLQIHLKMRRNRDVDTFILN